MKSRTNRGIVLSRCGCDAQVSLLYVTEEHVGVTESVPEMADFRCGHIWHFQFSFCLHLSSTVHEVHKEVYEKIIVFLFVGKELVWLIRFRNFVVQRIRNVKLLLASVVATVSVFLN